ncbi:TetR/AcrR family transcriptional regulator [Streptomyces mirabilis]|uniref:TetR/AcrR family transcriptional regulator n=1 Tax=Streptomyces mirabilis TaxID=68239 RepID=UPI0033226EE5
MAKREEILKVALEGYRTSGWQGPSLKAIAAAVGLTEAGVLHYFGSKDELFVAILQARDQEYRETYDLSTLDGVWRLLAHTTQTPGLVRLFVDMTAASGAPAHPAHAFMQRRASAILELIERILGPGCEWQARVLLAAAEGLQIQWLRDPRTDIVADLKRLEALLDTAAVDRSAGACRCCSEA